MNAKDQLLLLIEKGNWTVLPDLLKEYGRKRRKHQPELEETLKEINLGQQNELWKAIFQFFTTHYLGKYFHRPNLQVNNSQESEGSTVEDREQDLLIFKSMLQLASLQLEALLTEKDKYTASESLIQFIVLIGGLLSEFEDSVQDIAVDVCESWVLNDFENGKQILVDTFLTLMKKSIQPKAKKQDVKRVCALRRSLSQISLEDNANPEIANFFVLCATSSNYLSCDEGLKFLSTLFSIETICLPFHKLVKKNFSCITKAQSSKYSQVYFRTWKNGQPQLKKIVEEQCLQDLMYMAVHAEPFASHLSSNLNNFLHHIHKYKKHPPTATMIYRLYEPFIWRSLKVANGYVRMNATILFCDAFPFSNVDLDHEERELLMEQQYTTLITLLTDPCHLVRLAAVKGIFAILSYLWLMVPSHIIQKMFQILLSKLIIDASSAEIRMQVVKGITQLIDCADAGPFIIEVLPKISDSFNDVNASVRIAFIKLLLKVKATSLIKYWTLVPIEHLLIRLVDDVHVNRMLITHLVQPSFLPTHLDEQEMLQRCIALIEMNRGASRRFYQYASKKLDIEATTRFILLIWRTLHRYIQTANALMNRSNSSTSSADDNVSENDNSPINASLPGAGKNRKKVSARRMGNKENKVPDNSLRVDKSKRNSQNKEENSDASEMPLDNPDVVGGLLDTIVILWTINAPRLRIPQNMKYLEALRTRITKNFHVVWRFFKENDEISKTLLYLSSFLPRSNVQNMVGLCLSRLRSVDDNMVLVEKFETYVNALCNWNRIDDIMEIISEWLESGFKSALEGSNTEKSKKARKSARVCFHATGKPKPYLGLRFLRHILEHPLNKLCLMQNNKYLLVQIFNQMASVKKLIEIRVKKCEPLSSSLCNNEFILSCWSDYLCITSILNCNPPQSTADSTPEGNARPERTRKMAETSKNVSTSEETFDSVGIHVDCIDWMQNLMENKSLEMVANDNSLDSAFIFQCASRLLKAGSDLIAIGVSDLAYISKYLDFNNKVISQGAFNVDLFRISCLGISQTHLYLCAYNEGQSHLLPSSSITKHAFEITLSVLVEKREEVRRLQPQEVEKAYEAIGSTILTLGQESDLLLNSISAFMVKSTLSALISYMLENSGSLQEMTRVMDLNVDAKMFVLPIHKNTKLAQSYMQALVSGFGKFIKENSQLLSAVHLLAIFHSDSGRISRHSLKETVIAAANFAEKIDEQTSTLETSANDAEESRLLERTSLKHLKESRKMLQELQTLLQII